MEKSNHLHPEETHVNHQAIRTKSFRKVSLLDVPCPQNFIPGVNKGHLLKKTPPQILENNRLKSLCYKGIVIDTSVSSKTNKGLLHAGLIALTLSAPSKHCLSPADERAVIALRTATQDLDVPPNNTDIADKTAKSNQKKRKRSYSIPLILDITDIPPFLLNHLKAINCCNVDKYNQGVASESCTQDFDRDTNLSELDDFFIPCIRRCLSDSEFTSYNDVYSKTFGNQENSKTEFSKDKKKEVGSTGSNIFHSSDSIETLSKNGLNMLKQIDSIVIHKPQYHTKMAQRRHYGTSTVTNFPLRHGTLIYPTPNRIEINHSLIPGKISDSETQVSGNSDGSNWKNAIGGSEKVQHFQGCIEVDNQDVRAEKANSLKPAKDVEASEIFKTENPRKCSSKKISTVQPIEPPRSKEEKKTFTQIQDAMRLKLPKTFRTTVRMGLFTDPVNLQETMSEKEKRTASQCQASYGSQRSYSLTPGGTENQCLFKRRTQTNPDFHSSFIDDSAIEKYKKTKNNNLTFPKIFKENKENKKFDLFSLFRSKEHKISNTFGNVDIGSSIKGDTEANKTKKFETSAVSSQNTSNAQRKQGCSLSSELVKCNGNGNGNSKKQSSSVLHSVQRPCHTPLPLIFQTEKGDITQANKCSSEFSSAQINNTELTEQSVEKEGSPVLFDIVSDCKSSTLFYDDDIKREEMELKKLMNELEDYITELECKK